MEHLDSYRFGKSVLDLSAGNFRSFIGVRYPNLNRDEVNYLVEKFYGHEEFNDPDLDDDNTAPQDDELDLIEVEGDTIEGDEEN